MSEGLAVPFQDESVKECDQIPEIPEGQQACPATALEQVVPKSAAQGWPQGLTGLCLGFHLQWRHVTKIGF